jgi:hypothetical protein
MIIQVLLPIRERDLESILRLVEWIQKKNHGAYCSHRKKRIAREKVSL